MSAYLPPTIGVGSPDHRFQDDASMLEPSVRTGHIIPYHTVSRPALRRVTEDGLRMGAVFAPAAPSSKYGVDRVSC